MAKTLVMPMIRGLKGEKVRCRWSGALRGCGPMRRPHIPCETAVVAGEAITLRRCVAPKVVPLSRSGKPKVGSIELDGVAAAS
uniref:Uncharacterized protein n=1 Tax=Oryza meridionalis TaxID=40149 RepID=A0A0E0EIK0_9ORYZ